MKGQPLAFQLVDRTNQSGLEFEHFDGDDGNKYLVQFMGAGMASLDYDCDGMTGVIVLNGCKLPVAPENAQSGTSNQVFRNHGDFHEDCIQTICDDLVKLMKPCYLEVIGEFTPRGGIAIFPFASYANRNKEFHKLLSGRKSSYAPGKFSMSLDRLY